MNRLVALLVTILSTIWQASSSIIGNNDDDIHYQKNSVATAVIVSAISVTVRNGQRGASPVRLKLNHKYNKVQVSVEKASYRPLWLKDHYLVYIC